MTENETKMRAEIAQLQEEKAVLEERLKNMQEQLDKPVQCSRCGNPAANKPPKVDPAIVEEYFRSVLGQRPFTHTYTLMNGALILEFSSQFGTNVRELDSAIIRTLNSSKVMSDAQVEELMMVTALTSIQVFDATETKITKLYEADAETRKKYATDPEAGLNAVTSKIDRMTYQLVRRTFQKFVVLCSLLVQAAEDENFYKGVGLL